MIKILSCTLVSIPILIFGFYNSYKDSYRRKDLAEVYKAFNIFKNEITYSYRTLEEVFLSISKKVDKPISEIFLSISESLGNEYDDTFEDIFKNIINEHKKNNFLSERDINEFIDLSKTINHLDDKSIVSSVNIFLSYIETELNQLNEIVDKNKKTYQSLTILSTILVFIILL